MFGLFKNKKKTPKKAEKRKGQRRSDAAPRRNEVRWEPDKTDRRSGKDRRKENNTWDDNNNH